jgi:Beta-lactamase
MSGRPRTAHDTVAHKTAMSLAELPIGQVARRAGVGVQAVRYYECRDRRADARSHRLPVRIDHQSADHDARAPIRRARRYRSRRTSRHVPATVPIGDLRSGREDPRSQSAVAYERHRRDLFLPDARGRGALQLFLQQLGQHCGTLFEPDEFVSYSNGGMIVAGRLLEVVTGTSFHDLLERELFAPAASAAVGDGLHHLHRASASVVLPAADGPSSPTRVDVPARGCKSVHDRSHRVHGL